VIGRQEENHGVFASRGLPAAAPGSKQANTAGPSAGRTAGLLRDHMIGRAAKLGHVARRVLRSGICLGFAACAGLAAIVAFSLSAAAARAEGLPEALAKAYQTNPQLNAERARQRATDENVPQALSGYRPQIIGSLSGGLQAVRNLLPDNTIQSATLKPWTIGVTVTQTLFNGFKTANSVRVAELQVRSGREALRNVGQGVLLDAVTAYSNVLANQSLVEAQRSNVAFLRETVGITQKRLNAGDVTPTDTAQAEARLSRGLAELNAAEVNLAVSQATYTQIIGSPPSQLRPADNVDRYAPRSRDEATALAFKEHPAVMAAGFDVDVASTTIQVAEGSLLPSITVQGSASHSSEADPTISTLRTDQASVIAQMTAPIYDGGAAASQTRQAKELAAQSRLVLDQVRNQAPHRGARRLGHQRRRQSRGDGIGIRSTGRDPGPAGRPEGSRGRAAHHGRRAEFAGRLDLGESAADWRAARPRDRLLYAAQRSGQARRQNARA
jgi:outer membrane protein